MGAKALLSYRLQLAENFSKSTRCDVTRIIARCMGWIVTSLVELTVSKKHFVVFQGLVVCEQRVRTTILLNSDNVNLSMFTGSLPTCEMCNNAADLLKSSSKKKYPKQRRAIIVSFQRSHLKAQQAERDDFELRRQYCKNATNRDGSPAAVLVAADFKSAFRGHWPKFKGFAHGDAKQTEFR